MVKESGGSEESIRLIAGLGNPGSRYVRTRHNIGFRVVDALAKSRDMVFIEKSRWQAAYAQSDHFFLLKPQSFMNRSGEVLAKFSRFHRILPKEILVVVDDTALPLGAMRFRLQGSAGGHNGLKSIIQHLGTQEFSRLRIGIGSPHQMPLEKFVLEQFTFEEEAVISPVVTHAAEALQKACALGMTSAMNLYNQTNKHS